MSVSTYRYFDYELTVNDIQRLWNWLDHSGNRFMDGEPFCSVVHFPCVLQLVLPDLLRPVQMRRL